MFHLRAGLIKKNRVLWCNGSSSSPAEGRPHFSEIHCEKLVELLKKLLEAKHKKVCGPPPSHHESPPGILTLRITYTEPPGIHPFPPGTGLGSSFYS